MKKILISIIGIFILCGVVFTQNQSSKFDFTSDELKPVSDSFIKCPQDIFTNPSYEEIDVRMCDLSNYDLSSLPEETLDRLTFDDKTIWPKVIPEWLNIRKIYQIGKTPGLNIKNLHSQGITGKGVSIAIIDQPLSPHQEYNQNITFYKDFTKSKYGSMHGAAVTSIAVGKNVGVAPEAKVYYIAGNFTYYNERERIFNADLIAENIEYLLELNKTLPRDQKIFVISISRGFGDMDHGRDRFLQAIEKAEKQGVLVLTTEGTDGSVFTISRNGYYADPDKITSYTKPAYWFGENIGYYNNIEAISVPTDYRVISSHTGINDYVAYANGGLSWGVPYLAGIAALAKQVNPGLTPQEFLDVAFETAQSVQVKNKSGQSVKNSTFINPQALIQEVKSRRSQSQNTSEEENINNLEKALKSLQKNFRK